ncbi:MAG: molybdopterin molybdotransferase MoeA [Planctomycetes bacterium]|nr:molybdopterin molybdotransferase MoeA [Planctomycetota bacterium]
MSKPGGTATLEPMIDVEEAHRILQHRVEPGPVTDVPLREAYYRTLAAQVCCDADYPPFDRSVMDGFAVRAADTVGAPVMLQVVGQVAAGATPGQRLATGEAIQINTGAPIPPGADAVVRVEDTEPCASGRGLRVRKAVDPGQFITPRGAYGRAGQAVLEPGAILTPINVGVAATAGAARVSVYRPVTAAILATGDELVDIDRRPSGGQIRNSNVYLLDALFASAHVLAERLSVVRDERDAIRGRVEEGLRFDVLCITGGVSMGAFDFVPEILRHLNVDLWIEKMAIKPGRPVIVGRAPSGCLVFALPGNPMSAFVGFELLVRPALAALEGRRDGAPVPVPAVLRGSLGSTGNRRSYLPARARFNEQGRWEARPLEWHGSGDSLGGANANALVMRPPGSPPAGDGDRVEVLVLPGH